MCNPQKNECFCKHGFVAIQEEEKVVCRTLLTELYCRVDSDCVHVDGSVCHPGAGKCVCPSGKIYVPQLHACRQRFELKMDKHCEKCLLKQGTCFLYDLKDQPVNSEHASNVGQFLRAVTMKSAQPRLQLRVLNEKNLIIDSVVVGELIRLEVVSVDDKYPAYPITIDYCAAVSYHNHGRRLSENHVHRFIRKVIWETRCKKNGLLTPFLSDVKWVELDPTIWSTRGLSATPHRSRSLTAFRVIPEETRVTITCAVRYCLVQDCIPIQNVSTFCSRAMTEFYDQQFHLLTTMLSVKKPVQSTVSCRLISCITVSQLLLGCMVMLFLDLIVFSLLVWSYRHKLIWRLKPTPKSELQPRGDSGIIPELSMSSTAQNDLFDSCLIGQPLMGVSGHRSTEGTDMESVRDHLHVCEFYLSELKHLSINGMLNTQQKFEA
ncbi:hypothetical protein CLF_104579 [Clonorchis sinensis]|uniref:Uncharacterized protein n=1 Tax=Clonorchis sinensis TaxID=79923 RepID=G7YBY2_CLOSI|nr:hypothetical protein CLF_104579 [Clonorchis sinensis]